jgi:hypothetical protein
MTKSDSQVIGCILGSMILKSDSRHNHDYVYCLRLQHANDYSLRGDLGHENDWRKPLEIHVTQVFSQISTL